jgi:hypothetical protein
VRRQTLCHRLLLAYRLNRPRVYDWGGEVARCGKPLGHKGNCVTEEALALSVANNNEYRREKYRAEHACRA